MAAALRRVGYWCHRGGTVRDYCGAVRQGQVDLVADILGQLPLGLLQAPQAGVIELIADWWQTKVSQEALIAGPKTNYARERVLESLEQPRVDISKVKEIEVPDGSVVFEVVLAAAEMEPFPAAHDRSCWLTFPGGSIR